MKAVRIRLLLGSWLEVLSEERSVPSEPAVHAASRLAAPSTTHRPALWHSVPTGPQLSLPRGGWWPSKWLEPELTVCQGHIPLFPPPDRGSSEASPAHPPRAPAERGARIPHPNCRHYPGTHPPHVSGTASLPRTAASRHLPAVTTVSMQVCVFPHPNSCPLTHGDAVELPRVR